MFFGHFFTLFLFPKNVQNQTEKDAQQDAGCHREVKRETAASDPDIPAKAPQAHPGKKVRVIQQETGCKQEDSHDDQNSP
jgi:hypothetical protein